MPNEKVDKSYPLPFADEIFAKWPPGVQPASPTLPTTLGLIRTNGPARASDQAARALALSSQGEKQDWAK